MSIEYAVLKRLVNDRGYRAFLRNSLASGVSLDRLTGLEVGFLDLDEADRFGALLARQYELRQFMGGASVVELYATSVGSECQTSENLIFEFLESSEFVDVQQVPSTGSGVPVELGFYRFLQRKKLLRGARSAELVTLEHEYRRAIALAISAADNPAFSLNLPGFRRLAHGQWSALDLLLSAQFEKQPEALGEGGTPKQMLYYGGKRFVAGPVSARVVEILEAASHLRFLQNAERESVLTSLFGETGTLQALNRLGLI